MSQIVYNHCSNQHSLSGPLRAFGLAPEACEVDSILDVGCGTGVWLRAAMEAGVKDVTGIDGVDIPVDALHFPSERFHLHDLTRPITLNRSFGLVFCLEVAEHLDPSFAEVLIDTLTLHGRRVLFSAACPGQPGEHHVHCQWPSYWQGLFNRRGFACADSIRWKWWNCSEIEVWYRQNTFMATHDPELAGTEPRIESIIHPEMLPALQAPLLHAEFLRRAEAGDLPTQWYFKATMGALVRKVLRRFGSAAARG